MLVTIFIIFCNYFFLVWCIGWKFSLFFWFVNKYVCMKELCVGELLFLFHSGSFDVYMSQLLKFNALLGVVHSLSSGNCLFPGDTIFWALPSSSWSCSSPSVVIIFFPVIILFEFCRPLTSLGRPLPSDYPPSTFSSFFPILIIPLLVVIIFFLVVVFLEFCSSSSFGHPLLNGLPSWRLSPSFLFSCHVPFLVVELCCPLPSLRRPLLVTLLLKFFHPFSLCWLSPS